MSLSQDLMAAEAQLEAIVSANLPIAPSEAAQLCTFLRECAVGAIELEAVVSQPAIDSSGEDPLMLM
jgi:hypothetical protein